MKNFIVCWKVNYSFVDSHFESVESCCSVTARRLSSTNLQSLCW